MNSRKDWGKESKGNDSWSNWGGTTATPAVSDWGTYGGVSKEQAWEDAEKPLGSLLENRETLLRVCTYKKGNV